MAQTAKKKQSFDLEAKLKGRSKSSQVIYWVIGGLIVVALIVPLALAVPSFLPKRKASYGTLPSAAETKEATKGAGLLPPVSKAERESMIDGAKNAGIEILDDAAVSVHYKKDRKHATLAVPTGSGTTFRVKTYRLQQGGDGSWTTQ